MLKLPDPEQFNFKDVTVCGDDCWLITPKDMGAKWDDDNARFRSCIVRKSDNWVVSQGFGKFVNWGERPDFQPWNPEWPIRARHKLDGSLLIVSSYKGNIIARTRGTVDARQLANGHEIDFLIEKYDKFFGPLKAFGRTGGWSYLFEWTTPNNIIVLREHDEPTLTLLGMILNYSAQLLPQEEIDEYVSPDCGFERPKEYEYFAIEECIMDVDAWKGKEGVVIYSPDGQTMKKIKASLYCELHKMATGIKNTGHVLDVFMVSPRFTNSNEFYKYIESTLDYEIAEKVKDDIEKICEAYSKALTCLAKVQNVVDGVSGESFSRKEQALEIIQHYGADWRKNAAFSMLDKKELDDKITRNGIEYFLNN